MTRVLEGMRVIDCSQVIQAASAASVLRELGADVIKVEAPAGDISRTWTTVLGVSHVLPADRNATFEWVNRGKRSITLNLRTHSGREVLHRLVAGADVFLTNHSSAVRERLEFDYASLRAINPRLIYGVGNAYGSRGPSADEPGYDNVAFARSGMMYCVGPQNDEPQYMVAGLVDQAAGTMLALGVLAALVQRDRTGEGEDVSTSLLGSVIHLMSSPLNAYLLTGRLPGRPERTQLFSPLIGWYRCADEKWLMFSINRPQELWGPFCEVLGLEIADDPRFATGRARAENRTALICLIDERMATESREVWLERFRAIGAICAPVNSLADLPADAQVAANGYIQKFPHEDLGTAELVTLPLAFGNAELDPGEAAPMLSQHTEEILMELDYPWERIEALRDEGAI